MSAARAICEGLGFKALATTSSGYAHSQGFADGAVTRDRCSRITARSREPPTCRSMPTSRTASRTIPDEVAANVRLCVDTGVAGLSIEDFTGDEAEPIYDFDLAVARMKAARAAIDKAGGDVLLTGRAEGFLHGRPDLDEAIRRLKAFADAGADCLYVPGIRTREQIVAVVKAVAPKPVNLLNQRALGFTVRTSPAWACAASASAARWRASPCTPSSSRRREIAEHGKFDSFAGIVSNAELNKFFTTGRRPMNSEPLPIATGQPVGLPVDTTPAQAARSRSMLQGRYGRVGETRSRATPPACGKCSPGTTSLDLHLDRRPVRRRGDVYRLHRQARGRARPLRLRHHRRVRPRRRLFHADGNPPGTARHRGRPRALFAGAAAHAARHRGAISARALRLRDARLSPLRMEMQRAQCRLAPRRAALRLHLSKARSAST